MYYEVPSGLVGYCEALDYQSQLDDSCKLVSEDLKDALPYLYEKHFGKPYKELGWWLEDGAEEFVKGLEDKWLKNELDLSEVYKDEDFLKSLATEYTKDQLYNAQCEMEDEIIDELYSLSTDELRDLINDYGDEIEYVIYDTDDKMVAWGEVSVPELDEEEE